MAIRRPRSAALSQNNHRQPAPTELPRSEELETAMTLLPLIGESVDILQPPRSRSDDARGGGDIDCVVDRLDRLWPLRLPRNVTLLQCLHYDITGWFWVLDASGRVVKVDTLDDPKGIGSYGLPTRLWFEAGDDAIHGIRAAYLSAKRIRKDISANAPWEHIRSLAAGNPSAFLRVLEEMFGQRAGERIAAAVTDGGKPSDALWREAKRGLWLRRLRDPVRAASFAFRTIARIGERVRSPTGLVVLVAGPDGSGKSTLARSLPDVCEGSFRRALHMHWRPGILPALGRLAGAQEGDVTQPHARSPHGRVVSLGRLLYYWLDFVLGGWVRVMLWRIKSGLVVVERGWWDMAVDPRRYRMQVPRGLVIALGRLLPRPDMVLVLEATADTLLERKQEISADEAQRQTQAWRTVLPAGTRRSVIDASRSIDEVQGEARRTIFQHLEMRAMSRLGSGWVRLPTRRSPRWLLPRGERNVARGALSIYQPVTTRGRAGWEVARVAASLGGFRLTPRAEAPPRAIRATLAPHLPPGATIATMKANHPGRWVAAVISARGELLAIVKVALDDQARAALAKEADALIRLAPKLPAPLRAPTVLERSDCHLLLEACRWRPRARPWMLAEDVAGAMGAFYRLTAGVHGGEGAAHGDFAPWNLLRLSDGWVLIDWEHIRDAAPPFLDVFHYVVQAHALLRRPTQRDVVSGIAGGEGWVGRAIHAYASAASIDADEALGHFPAYLESSMAMLNPATRRGRKGIAARHALVREVQRLR
jgi:hypothetical protein